MFLKDQNMESLKDKKEAIKEEIRESDKKEATGEIRMEELLAYDNTDTASHIAYTPSSFAKTNLIHLQAIGEQKLSHSQVIQNDTYFSYLFFIVTDGLGKLEYEDSTTILSVGDCAFLDCRKPYSYCAYNERLTIEYVNFYGSNMAGIYDKYLEQGGVFTFRAHGPKAYIRNMKQIWEIASSDSSTRDMEIYEKLTALLTLLMGVGENTESRPRKTSKKQNLQNVKDYLDQNYQEKITLDNLSEKFFINKFYLTRLFKEQFGISINNYLIQVRVTHAKLLLRLSDMSIEKVGQECGISDANYFSRVFKKLEGISPGEYRKKWSE